MPYTYNLNATEGSDALQISRVRSRIDDISNEPVPSEGRHYFFSDARILDFLAAVAGETDSAQGQVLLAAADCAEVMANNLDFVVGDRGTVGQDWTRSKNATGLREQAQRWRAQVANMSATTETTTPGVVQRVRSDGYASAASEYSSTCVTRRCL